MREIIIRLPAELFEHFAEQRSGSDAVHVVIAKDDERFVAFARLEETFDGDGHVREKKRIGEAFEARLEETRDALQLAKTAVHEALGEQRRDFQGAGELPGEEWLWRRDCPA